MLSLAKSTLLSATLLAGAAFAAHAQSTSLAALPPGTVMTPPAATAPIGRSATYPGPNPGKGWYSTEQETMAVAPSPQYIGPNPGKGWYATERQSQVVMPSPRVDGPRPN